MGSEATVEVLKRANSLPFGLAGYAFTTSTRNAQAISDGLAVGMVAINHLGLPLVSLTTTQLVGTFNSHEGR